LVARAGVKLEERSSEQESERDRVGELCSGKVRKHLDGKNVDQAGGSTR